MKYKRGLLLGLLSALSLTIPAAANTDKDPETNYEEKLEYMYKEPNWAYLKAGEKHAWPLPKVNTKATGIYSMSMLNTIDYKNSENKFIDVATQYKHEGQSEIIYKNNPSGIVNMAYPDGAMSQKTHGGDVIIGIEHDDTAVDAYNGTMAKDELVLDSSQGQWLITNGIYSRDVAEPGIQVKGDSIITGALTPSPWGLTFSGKFIKPEDFLMALSKAVYGVEESRHIYMRTEPKRLTKKSYFYVWTTPPPPVSDCSTWWYLVEEPWQVREVDQINSNMMDYQRPGCGASKYMDRGEYIVHPEGYLNNVWQPYVDDQNVYVSPNVYELYFSRLLQKGIITTDEAFAFIPEREDFLPDPKKSSVFSFTRDYGNRFFSEYIGYGKSNEGHKKVSYPAWAPELGALYKSWEIKVPLGHNTTDKDIAITYSGGANAYERALGSRYRVAGSNVSGPTSIKLADMKKEENKVMAKTTVKLIDALKLIERAMRVEHGDMTETEAAIITRKYGAQYLDDLKESDRITVSYLLAKGILNFENHQEYAYLYSPLPEGFAYKLIYRVANEEARLTFSKVTLTDNSELPSAFRQIEQTITRVDLAKLSEIGSITPEGELVKNGTQEPLNIVSDIEFKAKATKTREDLDSEREPRYIITSTIDDPLKYLYRDLPLVNVDASGKPRQSGNTLEVYYDGEKELYNGVSEKAGRYVGINKVTYVPKDLRYEVQFYVYADSYEDAVKFIKANLTTRIAAVTESEVETSVLTKESGAVTSNKADDIVEDVAVNKDIVVNEVFDLSSYSNTKTSIAGNAIVHGSSTVKVGDSTMTSVAVLPKLSDKTVVDPIGTNQLITLNIPQLNANTIDVFNNKGVKVGSTKVLQGNVTGEPTSTSYKNIVEPFSGFNINLLKTVDMLTLDREFTYTDFEGNKSRLRGHVVLSWKLDLPSIKEQDALVGPTMRPYINDASGSSWIFTRPNNVHLRSVWDYNIGLNKAILKTVAGAPLELPSGYFAPTVDILIDSVESETVYPSNPDTSVLKDLTRKQYDEIKNQFFNEVAANLDSSWVKAYIGSVALANYVVGTKDKNGRYPENVRDSIDTELSTSTHTHIKKTGMLRDVAVKNGTPGWVGMVFNQTKPYDTSASYLDNHSGFADFNMYSIYTIKEGIKYYGFLAAPGTGDGAEGSLTIRYAKDPFANLYRNMQDTDYTFHSSTETITEDTSDFRQSAIGEILTRNGEEWVVANETEYVMDVFSRKMMAATLVNGKLVTTAAAANSKASPVLDIIKASNERSFGFVDKNGINSNLYMATREFTFTPRKDDIEPNVKFIAVRYGQMKPYQYVVIVGDDGGTTTKLEPTTLKEGEVVYVPQFVSLFKSTWHLEGNKLTWSKSFLGANPESYNKGDLVQMMKEQLLALNSPNIILSQNMKEGFLDTGSTIGLYEPKLQTFKVPFEAPHLNNAVLVESAVLTTFNKGADTVILPDGTTASATQYLLSKKVGGYNPTYKDYNNTLVIHDNKLKIATGTRLTEYTTAATIKDVSLTAILMDGVKLINSGGTANPTLYKFYTYQDVYPPSTISPFAEGLAPDQAISDSVIADVAEPFEGLPMALDLFDKLEAQLVQYKIDEGWEYVVFLILGSCVMLSMTTLLAHVMWQAPVSHQLFLKLFEATGVDILALMSVRAVSIIEDDEGVQTWKRTITTSFTLGILPVLVYSLMRIMG